MKANQKAKNNLRELKEELRARGLYLAIYLKNKHPQLVITNIDPKKNEGAKAICFFILPFFIPNDDSETIATPTHLSKLTIYSLNRKIQGIQDGLYNRISLSLLEEKIETLKKLKR